MLARHFSHHITEHDGLLQFQHDTLVVLVLHILLIHEPELIPEIHVTGFLDQLLELCTASLHIELKSFAVPRHEILLVIDVVIVTFIIDVVFILALLLLILLVLLVHFLLMFVALKGHLDHNPHNQLHLLEIEEGGGHPSRAMGIHRLQDACHPNEGQLFVVVAFQVGDGVKPHLEYWGQHLSLIKVGDGQLRIVEQSTGDDIHAEDLEGLSHVRVLLHGGHDQVKHGANVLVHLLLVVLAILQHGVHQLGAHGVLSFHVFVTQALLNHVHDHLGVPHAIVRPTAERGWVTGDVVVQAGEHLREVVWGPVIIGGLNHGEDLPHLWRDLLPEICQAANELQGLVQVFRLVLLQ
mmetsp:Transcript_49041/g.87441  ORF Transcript_49041/g.87441 Transcript_49041/m.87441 type:complete len:352 (+) Transcript_49041:441-1496(+)